VVALLFWTVWAVLTPAALLAVRRWPLDAKPVYRPLLAHAAFATALAAVHGTITLGVRSLVPYLRGGVGAQSLISRDRAGLLVRWRPQVPRLRRA